MYKTFILKYMYTSTTYKNHYFMMRNSKLP